MTKEEIIAGLKAGRTLCLDGGATPEEREIVGNLQEKNLVDVTKHASEQYTVLKIKWRDVA